METFSALLAICAVNSPVPGDFPAQRPVTRSFDVFCARTNSWVNNREAGDLRSHCAYPDVIVMSYPWIFPYLAKMITKVRRCVACNDVLLFCRDYRLFHPYPSQSVHWYRSSSPCKDELASNNETESLLTSRPLSTIACLISVMKYVYCVMWCMCHYDIP